MTVRHLSNDGHFSQLWSSISVTELVMFHAIVFQIPKWGKFECMYLFLRYAEPDVQFVYDIKHLIVAIFDLFSFIQS